MTALERLTTLIGGSEHDEQLLNVLLSDAADTVCDYIGRDTVPERLVSVQVQLALIAYNRRGSEGENARSEGGISRTFDGLPPEMQERLKNYPRKAGVLYTTGRKGHADA